MVRNGVLTKAITYANTTAFEVGKLPPNAFITDIKLIITTAFNAGGNDYVDVGTTGSANRYANDIAASSTGSASVTSTAYWGYVESATEPTTINAIYVPAGSTPTAGVGRVVVNYAFAE